MRVSWSHHFLKINELYEEVVNCTSRYFYTSCSVEPSKRTVTCRLCIKNLWWAQTRRQSSALGERGKKKLCFGGTVCELNRRTLYQKYTTELLVRGGVLEDVLGLEDVLEDGF